MYFILATFIFVLSLLLINKNKLYNDSVKQNELLSKNVSDLQEQNKNYTNYLFLGDSITDFYDLDKYFNDYKVVNSGISGNQTSDIYKDIKKRAYVLDFSSSSTEAQYFPLF